MTVQRCEYWLRIVLVLAGITMVLAVVGLVMPGAMMAKIHAMLKLPGEFPRNSAITEYLARLTSALYMLLGGLTLLLARDVRKYSGLITYLVVAIPAASVCVTLATLHLHMPLSWVVWDPLSAASLTVVTLYLQIKCRRAEAVEAAGKAVTAR